jgi:hypothetical protein
LEGCHSRRKLRKRKVRKGWIGDWWLFGYFRHGGQVVIWLIEEKKSRVTCPESREGGGGAKGAEGNLLGTWRFFLGERKKGKR